MAESISIVTPSLNQGRFIEKTIRSVLNQEIPNLEYWIVDGGSDDQTIEILHRYDARLHWVSEPDDGQAAAVNKGIDKSLGKIIGWLNSDDIYYPGALRRVLEFFAHEPEMSVIYGDANHIDEFDEMIGPYETEAWSSERLKEVCFLCQPAVFFRRDLIERYGMLDEALNFCMDYEFWLRLASGGERFHYLPRLLAGSRLYPENKTLATRVNVHAEINDMFRRRFGRVPDAWIFNYGHAVCDSRGLRREEHQRYSMAVATRSLGASLRWNRGVSLKVLRKALHWIFMSLWKRAHSRVRRVACHNARASSLALPGFGGAMKIGFDVSQSGREKAGCGVFAGSLIRTLIESDRENQYLLYPTFGDLFWDPNWSRDTFSSDRANVARMAGSLNQRECRAFWRDRSNGYEERMGSPDIVHSNNFFCPGALRHARLIFTLYDLSFLKHPEWTTEENRIGCFDGVFEACIRADLIMAISTSTRDHFRELFPHYPEERIRIVPGAGRPVPAAPNRRPESLPELEPDGFWLTVATVEPRKNHLRLLKAYARLKRERGGLLPIVFAGGKGWLMERLEAEISALGLDQDVFVLGYVEEASLAWLLRNCFAFIYPSLFEGFGLPVLEAMSCGRPVLTSSLSSLPEVAGEAAILVDPYSVRSIHSGLDRLAHDRELRHQLKALGPPRAATFSWETAAQRVLAIYEEAMRLPKYANS